MSILAELEKETALEQLQEMRTLLVECLHYGPVRRKFDGGRLPLFCEMCGSVIAFGDGEEASP